MKEKILIVTDAWKPQINGVVRTLDTTISHINSAGEFEVLLVDPSMFSTLKLPRWMKVEQEIQLAYNTYKPLAGIVEKFNPDYIHIAVEGPIGIAARKLCLTNGVRFTTAYHTMFPEYLYAKYRLPTGVGYSYMRWFHQPSSNVMVATNGLRHTLRQHGFQNPLSTWSRGVDTELFSPKHRDDPLSEDGPVLYVGRVSHEKNIEAFLKTNTSRQKVVVGDGPLREYLEQKYKDVMFVGSKTGVDLARYYANASAFVFPSRTDTFGLVMIEALASGTPVVAYDVPSPCDIITPDIGVLTKDDDLSTAIEQAIATIDRGACRAKVEELYTWNVATTQFLSNLVPVR